MKITMNCLLGKTALAGFVFAGCLAAGPAMAQVYKCPDGTGRTVMQQMPCSGGEQMKVAPSSATPSEVSDLRAKAAQMCEAALRSAPAWKDADSVKVTNVRRVGFTTIKMHDTTLAVVRYSATVNGKNSYGAYAGEKPASCYVNGTETKVLDVAVF